MPEFTFSIQSKENDHPEYSEEHPLYWIRKLFSDVHSPLEHKTGVKLSTDIIRADEIEIDDERVYAIN